MSTTDEQTGDGGEEAQEPNLPKPGDETPIGLSGAALAAAVRAIEESQIADPDRRESFA